MPYKDVREMRQKEVYAGAHWIRQNVLHDLGVEGAIADKRHVECDPVSWYFGRYLNPTDDVQRTRTLFALFVQTICYTMMGVCPVA